jgi:deoxyribose-phosphate aldolase
LNIAKYIDHTLLKQNATKNEILRIIEEAKKYQFASVCINPCWVRLAAGELKDSGVNVCTVIGFPLGAGTSAVKAFEAEKAIQDGAREIDMVINVGALKSGDREYVEKDIRAVVDAARNKALVKVIIEACLLSDEEKNAGLPIGCKSRGRLCKNFNRLFKRRRHCRRCRADETSRRERNRCKSRRRHSHERRSRNHDCGRRDAYRNQLRYNHNE